MSTRSVWSLGLPKAMLSTLIQHGYKTTGDLINSSVEHLSLELNISADAAQMILTACQRPRSVSTCHLSLSVSSMAKDARKFSTKFPGVDRLLDGGLSRGHVLEVSGPPGSPKEIIAVNLVSSFAEAEQEVIFIDCQNMVSAARISNALEKSPNVSQFVSYMKVPTLPELLVFLHQLSLKPSYSKAKLLVLNSISFLFQFPILSINARNSHLERIKQHILRACASQNLTVVCTSQLATKMLKADGSAGNFDTGAKGIMVPQLGPTYLPSSERVHRITLSPEGPTSGFAKLLSAQESSRQSSEPYTMDEDGINI